MPGPRNPLSVLMITGTWPPMPCGVGDYTARLCDELALSGARVEVLTSTRASPAPRVLGVRVHPLVRHWNNRCIRQACDVAVATAPDVIHFQWPTAAYGRSLAVSRLAGCLRRRFPAVPLVITLHELRYFKPWNRWRILPWAAHASRVILADPWDQPVLKRLHAAAARRSLHIPVGSSLPQPGPHFNRDQQRQSLGLTPRDVVVAFFGFANPPKGLDTLLDALQIRHRQGSRLKLLLISPLSGRDAYARRILRRLQTREWEHAVVRPGYAQAEQTVRWLASADMAALPFADGISAKRSSLAACLTLGLPVVSTHSQLGEPDGLRNGENILLVPPGHPPALAAALSRLELDPGLRQRIGSAAQLAANAWKWPAIAAQHQAVYQRIINNDDSGVRGRKPPDISQEGYNGRVGARIRGTCGSPEASAGGGVLSGAVRSIISKSRSFVLLDGRPAQGNPRGIGVYVQRLLPELAGLPGRAHDIHVALDQSAGPDPWPGLEGVEKIWGRSLSLPVWEQIHLPRLAAATGARLLHCTANSSPWRCPVPYVVTIHDAIFMRRLLEITGRLYWRQLAAHGYYRFGVPPAARRARMIITDSQFSRAELHLRLNLPIESIRVIHLASPNIRAPLPREESEKLVHDLQMAGPYALALGAIDRRKNIANLVRAFGRLPKTSLACLVLAGFEKARFSSVPKLARKLGIAHRLRIFDYLSERTLMALFQKAAVFVYPSREEGFGLPILQAFQLGVPVVTTRAGAIPEVAGDAAGFVDPEDPHGLAREILNVVTDPREAHRLALSGYLQAQRFTWKATAQKTYAAYEEALAG